MEQAKKSKLNDGEMLRFFIRENGIQLMVGDNKAVEDPIVAIGVSLGVYVATTENRDFRRDFANLVRSFKNGFNHALEEADNFSHERLSLDTDEKEFNKEEYK